MSAVATEERTLDWIQLAARTHLPRGLAQHAIVEVFEDRVQGLALQLRTRVLVDNHKKTQRASTSIDLPASPWQHFKQSYGLSWWLRWLVDRRPVITRKVTFNLSVDVMAGLAYPEAIVAPQLGDPVRIVTSAPSSWVEGL